MPSAIFLHPTHLGGIATKDLPLLFCGWVNPFVVVYLLFCIGQSFVRSRRVFAMAILACLACAWIVLAQEAFTPLIGHYLWVAGILFMLAPEALKSNASGPANETSDDGSLEI